MTLSDIPTTYAEADAMLGNRSGKVVANNTKLERTFCDQIGLTYHDTMIVCWHPNGHIELAANGWRTVTTKDRINRVVRAHGYNVFQKDHVWFVHAQGAAVPSGLLSRTEYFVDGVVVFSTPGGGILRPDDWWHPVCDHFQLDPSLGPEDEPWCVCGYHEEVHT